MEGWTEFQGVWRCHQCGAQAMQPIEHRCIPEDQREFPKREPPQHPASNWKPGDDLENLLTSIGITKERWVEVKRRLGLPPTCNCTGRQEWLNRAGELLQMKSESLMKAFNEYYKRPR